MKCPKCQTENPEGMKFCGECGADGWVEEGRILTSFIL
ncbi:MAG: zinc-ribbon domain-containing protein [Syntrophaceae bacterium]|nr:zinc-ribbon domain-containing protein [Syntrophaceae bacterium]